MTIKELCEESHKTAVEKGWWETDRSIPEQICLMHSELSEALEDYRTGGDITKWAWGPQGSPIGFPIEMADCIIRIADTCQKYGIDLEKALKEKMEYNKTRSRRHGGKRA